jgi:hypothetical protein
MNEDLKWDAETTFFEKEKKNLESETPRILLSASSMSVSVSGSDKCITAMAPHSSLFFDDGMACTVT